MKRFIVLALIAYFSFVSVGFGLLYSVMPDPEDDCRDCSEWALLKSESAVNISNYVVDLGGKNVSISGLDCSGLNKESFSGELVLADDRQKFLDLFCLNPGSVVVCDVQTSLNNDGDFVGVFDSSGLIEGGSYESANKNQTFCYSNGGFSSCSVNICGKSFGEGGGGTIDDEQNSDVIITNNLNGVLDVGKRYTSIYNIVFREKADCLVKDSVVVRYYLEDGGGKKIIDEEKSSEVGCSKSANTGEIFVEGEGEYRFCAELRESSYNNSNLSNDGFCSDLEFRGEYEGECDLELKVDVKDSIINLGEREELIFDVLGLKEEDFSLEYWVEDSSRGIVKDKLNTSNLDKKSFTPKDVVGNKEFVLKGVLYPECEDRDLSDNRDEVRFMVIGTGGYAAEEEISDEGIGVGSLVEAKKNFSDSFDSGEAKEEEDVLDVEDIKEKSEESLNKVSGKVVGEDSQTLKEKTVVKNTQILSAKNIFIFVLIVLVGVLLVSKS